jgi:hypothetical protein
MDGSPEKVGAYPPHRVHLTAFSNAHVERLIRLIALMRKNSLFVGTVEAGERYASLMTLLLNCVVCGANPYPLDTDCGSLTSWRQVA